MVRFLRIGRFFSGDLKRRENGGGTCPFDTKVNRAAFLVLSRGRLASAATTRDNAWRG
jgi:hypothetical protein